MPFKKRYLVAVIGMALAFDARAFDPFVIKEMRVEGARRTEPGTVFSYLPVKVGDTMTDEKATQAIRALYETGFFKDVKIDSAPGGIMVITVDERPSIAKISFDGIKEFKTEDLTKALKDVGLSEGRILDRSTLDKAEQELRRQYVSGGRYSTTVTTTVTPLENNRVDVAFKVTEGDVARIRQIKIIGDKLFPEKELLKQFTLTTPGITTWYTKNDQYSKQKLGADLEKLRSYYMDRGYLEFAVDSTQVSVSPDKRDIYITISINEGPQYTVKDVRMGGDTLIPEAEAMKLVDIKPGDVFSRAKLTESTKRITDRLGNDGYAFANVNAVPNIDREKHEASFTFFVDPGKRVYVRRVNVLGNTRTRDEVVRREIRQLEGAWFSTEKIDISKKRLQRLGYFEDPINIETPAVAGSPDQVDVDVTVKEKPTGSIMLGAGYGTQDGIILSTSISQQNIFGSGNHVALQVNTSRINTVYSLGFTNPYWTKDGISRSWTLYKRDVTPDADNLGEYRTSTLGGNFTFGFPLSEIDGLQAGLGYELTKITTYEADLDGDGVLDQISPPAVYSYIAQYGSVTHTLTGTVGWIRDSRDSSLWPTMGTVARVTTEVGLPGGNIKYYKLQTQLQHYFPLSKNFTLLAQGSAGYGAGYGGSELPFFKNFYTGGVGSVRGYESSTIGPKDINDIPTGGSHMLLASTELLFPIPGLPFKDRSVRASVFIDSGMVGQNYDFGDLRMSAGFGVLWASPFGPIKVSIAQAFRKQDDDKTQVLQFTFGNQF